jgi:hypothetical protein
LENQIGTKVTDMVDPLDVQYDRLGRPFVYTAAAGYKPTKFVGGYVNQWGNDISVVQKEK